MSRPDARGRSGLAVWLLAAVLTALPACAAPSTTQPPAAKPATRAAPAEPTTPQTRPAIDPGTTKVLLALEQAGQRYTSVRADLEMTVLLPALGDREQRTGWVAYRRGSDTEAEKIRVHFETLKLGDGPNTRQREDYTFDGHWACQAQHSVKQLTRWQVAPEGERVQALRIGKGAFPPLPFGQKAAEVLDYYDARLLPPAEGDPADCDHLELEALRSRRGEVDFLHLDLWVDRRTALPVKVVGRDKDRNTKTVVLSKIQTDVRLPDDMFELKPGFGWTVNTQPLRPRGREESSPSRTDPFSPAPAQPLRSPGEKRMDAQ